MRASLIGIACDNCQVETTQAVAVVKTIEILGGQSTTLEMVPPLGWTITRRGRDLCPTCSALPLAR